MGTCFSFICGASEAHGTPVAVAKQGRERWRAYLADTIKRLDSASPSDEELRTQIAPSVVASLQRLSENAPQQVRNGLRVALTKHRVLPKYEAHKVDLRAALIDCQSLLPKEETLISEDPEGPRSSQFEPSQDELATFNAVLGRLWKIDEDRRLVPETHYKLSHGSRAESVASRSGRASHDPLFAYVDARKLNANSCTRAFVALFDNYIVDSDQAEIVTQQDKAEMDVFMHSLMRTPHMQYAHRVLRSWRPQDVPKDPVEFEALVFRIWFTNYGIGRGPASTSGFEHTFVGEVDVQKQALTGMHNWIRFWHLEKAGQLKYSGYCGHISREDIRLVTVRFDWEGEEKDVSTFLVGTSVAFEFAMYTIAFLGYGGKCDQGGIYLGENVGPIRIQTYPWSTSVGQVVRSAFIRSG